MCMGRERHGVARRTGYFSRVALATLVVTVLPGLVAAGLQAVGVIHGWLPSAAVAVVLSMALAAAGSVWWARRPASRDIVFADLMLWGWLRRVRTERRLASARGLLGRSAHLDPARKIALLERLSGALESRDLYTHGHSRRVMRHSYRIARQLGLSASDAARIRTAAALHDVGKIETPREVLNKPGRLTDEEFRVIQRHPVDGAQLVEELGDDELTAMVRHHHERLDGGGYPDGLVGGAIPLGARVIAVADTFDALTSNRPYRTGCRHKKALDILRAEAGTQLDPDVVAAFLSYYSGRRALPWWSAVAEAPGRLATWMLSGIQGATAGPIGGGATSLGAAFLVGATLAGPPATGEAARAVRASTDAAPATASGAPGPERGEPLGESHGSGAADPGSSGAEEGAGNAPGRSSPGVRSDGERFLRSGAAAAGRQAVEVESHGGAAPSGGGSGGDAGGGDRTRGLPDLSTPRPNTGSDAGGGDAKGPGRVVDLPAVGERDDGGSDDRPKAEVPTIEVEVPEVQVPKVTVPKVDLPKVEVPPVEVPPVEVPPVDVPRVQVPRVQVPEVEVKPPPLRLP
jgi:putative nucleotidyltransferase with HDIG domain